MNVGEYRVPLETQREVMEMPWADLYGISQAVPPRYTEHIGAQLLDHLEAPPAPVSVRRSLNPKGEAMRKWLVLASHDEDGMRLDKLDSDPSTLERVTSIISGDGDKPMEGDINEALAEYGDGEYLFVPLDGDTFSGKLTVTHRVETVWEGNYV